MTNGLSAISGERVITEFPEGAEDDAEMVFLPEPREGVFFIAFEGPTTTTALDQVGLTFLRPSGAISHGTERPDAAPGEITRNPFPMGLQDGSSITLFDRFANAPERIEMVRLPPLAVAAGAFDSRTLQVQTLISDPNTAYLGARGSLTEDGFAVSALAYSSPTDDRPVAVFQLFETDGTPVGALQRLDRFTDYNRSHTLVTLDNGNVLAVFNSQATNGAGEEQTNLYTRLFDGETGAPLGGRVLRGENAIFPRVEKLVDGRIVISAAVNEAGQISEMFGVLSPDGLAQLGPIRRLSDRADQGADAFDADLVATADGGFLAVWTRETNFDFESRDVFIRRFDVDLEPLAESQRANVTPGGPQYDAEVAVSDANEVAVIWTGDLPNDGFGSAIFGRTYRLDDLREVGETRTGTASNDRLLGTEADDTLSGGLGRDLLDGGLGSDILMGGLGNDFYIVDTIGEQIVGEQGFAVGGGIDTVRAFVDYIQPQNVELIRLGFMDDIDPLNAIGNDAPGTLVGNGGDNSLTGRGGNDQLNGNYGDDVLIGNTGRDTLVGGLGNDTFVYTAYADSRAGAEARDVINGFVRFTQRDQIDLSALDAITRTNAVDDAFTFIGARSFSGTAGELRYQGLGGPNAVIVEADHNGDRVADLQLFVNLTTWMTGSDFIL